MHCIILSHCSELWRTERIDPPPRNWELEDYFIKEQQKAIEIKAETTKTDKEIDAMVYELYGLTDEEIAIIEND